MLESKSSKILSEIVCDLAGRKIKISGYINDGFGKKFKTALKQLIAQSSAVIEIEINSKGGLCFPLHQITSALKACELTSHGIVTDFGRSAGFDILQCCTKRFAYRGAILMFHAPRVGKRVCDEDSDHLEMVKILMRRTGQTKTTILHWAEQEREFTAEEALDAGLIDGIIERD